jgi:AcrR family transcriptional regulator
VTQARRRGRPGHDLVAVVAGAVEVFNERGYAGARMEDVARHLGISKSAIYHHVSSKEELLRLALDDALDRLFALADGVAGRDVSAVDRLEELVRGSVRVLSERQPYVKLLLRLHGNTRVERAALARRRAFDGTVAALVKQAVADGTVRPDVDPAITSRLLFGTVNSLVEWYRPRSATDHIDIADAVVRVTFDGLRARLSR